MQGVGFLMKVQFLIDKFKHDPTREEANIFWNLVNRAIFLYELICELLNSTFSFYFVRQDSSPIFRSYVIRVIFI